MFSASPEERSSLGFSAPARSYAGSGRNTLLLAEREDPFPSCCKTQSGFSETAKKARVQRRGPRSGFGTHSNPRTTGTTRVDGPARQAASTAASTVPLTGLPVG